MQGFYEGKSLSLSDGVLAPLIKHLLESMMEGELDSHLAEDRTSGASNQRNGKEIVISLNTVTFELETFRDRTDIFESKVVLEWPADHQRRT